MSEDWFENVENLRPLRGGRRGDTLNEVSSHTNKVTAENAEEKFRLALEAANQAPDPLAVMWDFVVWFEEHFPGGKQRLFYPMLYKICTTFCVVSRYKNDERMLKLWLKLAASFPESGLAVMEFAFTKGSCRQLAKFYIQWAEMYQTMECWNRAREKLNLGVKMCATPLPSLHSAIDELEARALRASVKASEKPDSDDDDDNAMDISDVVGSHRKMLGKLRGLGRKHNAPIIRLAQGGPGKIAKVQTPAVQKSFDVFVDNSEKVEKTSRKTNTVADQLRDDPDYQALFGFFDDREKVTLHLTNDENLSKSSSKMVPSKNSIVSEIPVPDFEVYIDAVEENKPRVAPLKARLKIRKCLAQVSVEEMYALRLYPKSVN